MPHLGRFSALLGTCLLLGAVGAQDDPLAVTKSEHMRVEGSFSADRRGVVLEVHGETAYVEETMLLFCLRYEGEVVPGSWGRAWVKSGGFHGRIGPLSKKLPSGAYLLDTQFELDRQDPDVYYPLQEFPDVHLRVPIRRGTVETELQEDEDFLTWMRGKAQALGDAHREVQKTFEDLAAGKAYHDAQGALDAAACLAWLESWAAALDAQEKEVRQFQKAWAVVKHPRAVDLCLRAARYVREDGSTLARSAFADRGIPLPPRFQGAGQRVGGEAAPIPDLTALQKWLAALDEKLHPSEDGGKKEKK